MRDQDNAYLRKCLDTVILLLHVFAVVLVMIAFLISVFLKIDIEQWREKALASTDRKAQIEFLAQHIKGPEDYEATASVLAPYPNVRFRKTAQYFRWTFLSLAVGVIPTLLARMSLGRDSLTPLWTALLLVWTGFLVGLLIFVF